MSDSSKFFKKYTLNNKVEVPSLLAVAPMTLFGSNADYSTVFSSIPPKESLGIEA